MVSVKILLCAVLVCQMALGVLSLANPAADARTKRIFSALTQLKGKILSGQFGGWTLTTDYNAFSMAQADGIKIATSKSPAVYGLDCSPGWSTSAPGKEADILECYQPDFAAYAKKGGLLTISHHLPNPFYAGNNANGQGAFKTGITNKEYATILQNGSPARKRWLAILGKVAAGLKRYQSEGITIVYRPFHEMNGDWFWWGATPNGSENKERMELFKKLWIDLFNFMNQQRLNNLIWLYSPDNSRQYKTGFYPGSRYVDMVGLDDYNKDSDAIDGYNEMISLGKPFCLGEVGPRDVDGNFDYNTFVKKLLSRYPKTLFFMSWNDKWSPLKNKGGAQAYNNPQVVNLGQFKF